MASSGVIYGSRKVNQWGPRLELHWDIYSKSIKDNTTTIRVRSYFNVDGTIQWSARGYEGNTRINDGVRNTYYYTSPDPYQRHRLMNTAYHTITHNSDGTASVMLEGWFNVNVLSWNGTNVSEIYAGGKITLDKIVRGIDDSSVVLQSGWSSVDGAKTVTFTKYSTTARVELQWDFYKSSTSSWTEKRSVSTNYLSGTSFSFSTQDITNLHTYNPNTKTVSVRVYIKVYQDTTYINTVTKSVTLNLRVEAPSVSGTITITGKNQSLLGNSLYAVQNIHSAKIVASATAKNGASIKSYEITFQRQKYTSSTVTSLITSSGNLVVTIKATDSRGFNYTKQVATIVSRAYSPPKLSSHRAFRLEGSVENPIGTTGRVTGAISITNVLNSAGTNINQAYWKISLDTVNTFNNANISFSKSVAIENSLSYTLYFGDKFSDLKVVGQIPSGQAPLVLGKKSVGINIVPGENLEGLFVKDDLLNGLKAALIYPYFFADYKTYGSSNYIEAVKLKWGEIREGISIAYCVVATRGIAIILKYPVNQGDYGMVLTFGYGAGIKRYKRSNGVWEELTI